MDWGLVMVYIPIVVAFVMWIATISLAVKRKDSFVALIHGAMGALTFLVSIWFPTIGSVCSLILIVIMFTSYRVIREYTRGVAFRLGKLKGILEAGIVVIAPFGIDQIKIVDMRTFTIDVPKQEVITKDNVPVVVDAVVYFNVFDSILAVTQVADYVQTTSLLGQTTLRSILGQHELDELLSKRSELNEILRRLLDEATDPWGIRISMVEMKSIELPDSMKRAMARQAEAERDRRAQVIAAEGEFQASEKLAEAARIMAQAPVSVQLRFLHTLSEIASEQNSTIVFPIPLPMDIIGMIGGLLKKD